jgi:TPR repeat protein
MRLNALDMDDPNLRFSKVERALRDEGYNDDDFKTLADTGNSNAQVLYGRLFRFKDDPKARYYYKRACESGNMIGCRAVGFSFNHSMNHEKVTLISDYDAARPYFEMACKADNALSCRALGNLYHFGRGVETNIDRARPLYEKSCDLGNYFGCNDLGVLYMDARGVPQDYDKAKALFEYACQGTKFGCANLQIVEKKMKRAAK